MPPHVLIHVVTGGIAVLAGAIALTAPKGRPWHIGAGRTFVITMLISAGVGAVMGLLTYHKHLIAFHAGVLACYLVLSSWVSARRRAPSSYRGPPVILLAIVNLLNMAGLIAAGVTARSADDGMLFTYHSDAYLFMAGLALAGVIGDLHILIRQTLSARSRIARHLWRMCVALVLAAGSLFTGPGAKAFPDAVRASGILSIPEPVILLVMVFWLARTFWPSRRRA
ncbi:MULTISPECIES: hypothetical protein [Asticcacaulis]|uniref:hypothetical protein n=1 Tax=Asticcacaulis TaxID=76890 RepID=UPI001AEB0D68|nr:MULTISPECIES: hypothetical protein [Asticcacaulis]MBP2158775.1 putative membrane protein [Asticcacaulis solisilvae]MDR6799821.1 putative membrane protein [Asticcacaulis sp. BE141]